MADTLVPTQAELADELERQIALARSDPAFHFSDPTHFVFEHEAAILTALRTTPNLATAVEDELIARLEEMAEEVDSGWAADRQQGSEVEMPRNVPLEAARLIGRLVTRRPTLPDDRDAVIARMQAALKPFADCCDQISDDESDEEWAKFRLLIGDYRRARIALSKHDRNEGGDDGE